MARVRYRTHIASLLAEVMGDTQRVAVPSVTKLAESTGISRQTLHAWIKADSDDERRWLRGYDPETARKLRTFFAGLLERNIKVIERHEEPEAPSVKEAVAKYSD